MADTKCDSTANNRLGADIQGPKVMSDQKNIEERNLAVENDFCKAVENKPVEPVRKASLFLRPSALSSKATPILKSSALNIPRTTNSTRSDDSESQPKLPQKNEKPESSAPPTTRSLSAAVPLSNPNYVFGENIRDRVVTKSEGVANGNGDTLLFTSAVAADTSTKEKNGREEDKETTSLVEDAARCQEQRSAKRKYEEVQVTTGEEEEINVIQMVVKLFAFESGSWVERGRGTLRLNDQASGGGGDGSRIVIRTLGCLKVILNAKIWSGMELSRASEKSIRITAMDALGVLRIFLIQASPSDTSSLYNHMTARIKRCQESKDENKKCPSNEAGDGIPDPKIAALESSAESSTKVS